MKTLKQEEIYTRQYRDRADLEQHIAEFLEQYNNRQRLHSALNYCSPEQFEQSLLEKPTALPAASLSFLRHEETIVPIAGIQSREQQRSIRHHSRCHRCDESPAEYSSASCSPVELASASSASLMLNQQPSLVQHNAANGNRGMSLLSHLRGHPRLLTHKTDYSVGKDSRKLATELGQNSTLAPRFQKLSTIVWIAWLCREIAILVGHTYRFSKLAGSFGFGWEGGRIASAIATGHGFSSPFRPGTGPTAWLAPVYPYLLAGIFKVFGVYSTASSIATLSLNSIFSALTVIPVFYIAKRAFGERVALWSAWLAALLPYAWYWAIRWAWETSLATLLLACVFLLTMRMGGLDSSTNPSSDDERHPRRDWILYGLLWGLIALTNPSLLLWLPFSGIWLLHKQVNRGARTAWVNALLSAVIFVALLAPWSVRNYRVFHRFIPIRGNFWVELHMGNGEDANGLWRFWLHPSENPTEFAEYKRMGEVAYVQSKKREVLQFIRSNPGKFAELCLERAAYYWYDVPRNPGSVTGSLRNIGFLLSSILAFSGLILMWRRKNTATFLFGSLLLAVPLIYYVTFPHPRYRAPIEPEMLILMVYLFAAAERRRLANRSSSAMAGTACQQS